MKIHIATSMPAGEECIAWAKENLPEGVELVETIEESELLFSVFYNKLFPENFLEGRTCVNFHAGILPFYRGSSTFNWALINGEKEAGITLHIIDKYIDHGPIIAIEKFPITESDTGWSLFQKSSETAVRMFQGWFQKIIAGDYTATPQDHAKAKLYTRADFQGIKDLTRIVRAFEWPGKDPSFYINKNGEKILLHYGEDTEVKK